MKGDREQQRLEFVKYTKFFTIRLIQAVVQSRLGEKQRTNCGILAERNDWFNLKIEEYGEITNEIQQATESQFPPDCQCLSVEFQLQTCDGERLPLESWALQFDSSVTDESVGIRTHFYHQLGTLIKSALSASRVTPSYRNYVRRQGPDSFIICYRIFRGEPNLLQLGEGYRTARLGHLASPFGSLYLDLHYRTKMVISSGGTNGTVLDYTLKENYYEDSAKPAPETRKFSDDKPQSFAPVPSFGNFQPNMQSSPPESCFSTFSTSPASMDLPWFGGTGPAGDSPARRPSVGFQVGHTSESSSDGSVTWPNRSESTMAAASSFPKRNNSSGTLFRMELSSGSFPKPSSLPERGITGVEEKKESFPFSALLTASSAPTVTRAATEPEIQKLNSSLGDLGIHSQMQRQKSDEPVTSAVAQSPTPPHPIFENPTDENEDSSDDSFVKVDITPLFSTSPEKAATDLGSLVREFKSAPPQLHSFDSGEVLSGPQAPVSNLSNPESLDSLTAEIHRFEEQRSQFDRFVESLKVQQNEDDDY